MQRKQISVLMITRTYWPEIGGVASHTYYLSYALSKLNKGKSCVIHVLTPGEKSEGIPPNLIVHRSSGTKGHFKVEGESLFEEPLQYSFKNWSKIKPDVIHVHDFESAYLGLMFKAAFKTPLLMTVHKTPKDWDKTLPQRDTKDCFLEAVLRYQIADKLIAPSEAYKERLLNQGFRDSSIERIYHGVPIKWLASWPSQQGILDELKITNNHIVIFCPIRLDPHKGPEIFIDAAAHLKTKLQNRKLVFVISGAGTGAYRTRLIENAQRASLQEEIRFGHNDGRDLTTQEMPTLYRRASLCVVPSQREGMPQAVLEAFVFKKPVIASNTGGIPEVIDNPGVNGLLFHRNEPEDLSYQMESVLKSEALARGLGQKGFETVKQRFDAERMARDYLDLYLRITTI